MEAFLLQHSNIERVLNFLYPKWNSCKLPKLLVDILRYPWITLDILGYSWMFLDIFGYSWLFLDIYLNIPQYSSIFVDILWYSWIILGILGYSWMFVDILGYSWIFFVHCFICWFWSLIEKYTLQRATWKETKFKFR